MATTTSANDIETLLSNLREQLKIDQDATNQSTFEADLQKRKGDAVKKVNTDLAKATDLESKQESGELALTTNTQAYESLLDHLDIAKGFHDDHVLLNGSMVAVDYEIELLREAWWDAQAPKADADSELKKYKLDEDRKLAKLEAVKSKLVGLPKSIQDRTTDIDKKRQAVSDALEKDDLVTAGIALTDLKEALDAGAGVEGKGIGYEIDDIFKKKPVSRSFPLPPKYESLKWLLGTDYEANLVKAILAALDDYIKAIVDTAQATRDLQIVTDKVADYEKRLKDAQTNRITNIKIGFSKAQAVAADEAAKSGDDEVAKTAAADEAAKAAAISVTSLTPPHLPAASTSTTS